MQLLTIDEASRFLNVSKTSLRRWTNAGQLPCHRVGVRALRRFALADLEEFLRSPLGSGCASDQSKSPLAALDAGALRGCVRHVCSHFTGIEQSWELFRPYFVHHAERGAPIFYIHDSTPRERLLEFIRSQTLFDPDDLSARGLLELGASAGAYLPSGTFSAHAMLSYVEATIVRLRRRGHPIMLISGEMTWSLTGAPGSEAMISYEEQLNDILTRYPGVTIVCHYSMEHFGAQLTLDALRAHPLVQLPQGVFPGFYSGSPPGAAQNRGSM